MRDFRRNVLASDLSEKIYYTYEEYPMYIRRDRLSAYPGWTAASHWHSDPEMILVLSGEMIYCVNGQRVPLAEGSGILINSQQLHYGFSDTHTECEFVCFIISPTLLAANEFFERSYVRPILENEQLPWVFFSPSCSWQKEALNCLGKLYQESLQKEHFLEMQQQLLAFWGYLFRNLVTGQPGPQPRDPRLTAVKAMVSFIHENYREKITLSQIARAGNVCRSKCSLLFRQYLSRTPVEYLTEYRLRKSLDHLMEPGRTIGEIGYQVGITGASYYSELFRRYFSCTPKEYIKRHRAEAGGQQGE